MVAYMFGSASHVLDTSWNARDNASAQAIYTNDRRSLKIKLNERAEGGVRWDKVSLPFDPDLYEHMLEHGYVGEFD